MTSPLSLCISTEGGKGVQKLCRKCEQIFHYQTTDCFWDDQGYGYSTKLVRCPECGQIQILEHVEDISLDINNDERFYTYGREELFSENV